MTKVSDHIRDILSVLPQKPGVYQFKDETGKIIYIGKAKNLKKRVSSYFTKNHESRKLHILVRKIRDLHHIVVNTEMDALLLENNLIKKYQPRYNVQLKDDKSFPWICIKNEPFPRVFLTRNIVKDGSLYFGPYTSAFMTRTLVNVFKQIYKFRTCSLNLTEENIKKGKFKVCLEYHIGNCKGPCEGKQQKDKYESNVEEVKQILKGNISGLIRFLKETMDEYSGQYQFEIAEEIKQRLLALEKFQNKSTIVNPQINNVDVFSIVTDESYGYVNFLKVVNGSIIQAQTIELRNKLEESKEDLLIYAITEIRSRFHSNSKEVLVPFVPEFKLDDVNFIVPKIGDKKKLLDLSTRNAKYYQKEQRERNEKKDPQLKTDRILHTMQKDLRLNKPPEHIECFDNSNLQGSNPVAACVVFKNAKPSKKDYRKFNIKTVEGPDDFASMKEVVWRRYKRLIEENAGLPDLIIIDGGKGQLNAAWDALKQLDLQNRIAIIGIAKRLEEIFFHGDSVPIYIDKKSETLKIIQHLRNEAHRFGITFHRQKRSKKSIESELNTIPGIGPVISQKLLREFGSVKKIKTSTLEELKKSIGEKKATIVHEYLNR